MASTETQTIDTGKAEAFGERMLGAVNDASLIVMTSLGHRIGLFDAMAQLEPSTSAEIAAAAGLEERYVREWLGAMVVGGVVEYDPDGERYVLPPEHAASLTRAAGPDNLGAFAAYVPLFAGVEDEVTHCFRNGGGVPYSSYPRLQETLREDTGAVADATLVDVTLALVPGLVDRLNEGIDVADVGCGAGPCAQRDGEGVPRQSLRRLRPLRAGDRDGPQRSRGDEPGEHPIRDPGPGHPRRARRLRPGHCLRRYPRPGETGRGARSHRRRAAPRRHVLDGRHRRVEQARGEHRAPNRPNPVHVLDHALHDVSMADDGAGLGTVWGEQKALEMLRDAGFDQVDVKSVEGDFVNNYYIARASG